MENLSQLLHSEKTLPRLWIEQINIYSSPTPDGLLRPIRLHTGVNIICAEEPVAEIHASGKEPGKKSLCKLIRYCLADTTKAVTDFCKELHYEYPFGGVGAVIHLKGKAYSVFRFFSPCRDGWMMPGDNIDNLWSDAPKGNYRAFESLLSAELAFQIYAIDSSDKGKAIDWQHLLAWMVRDQESSFQSYFSWRNVEESSTSSRSCQSPHLVLLATLGLLDLNKSRLAAEITQFKRELAHSRRKKLRLSQQLEQIPGCLASELSAFLGVSVEIPKQPNELFWEPLKVKLAFAVEKTKRHLAQIAAECAVIELELKECREAWHLKKQELDRIHQQVFGVSKDERAVTEFLTQQFIRKCNINAELNRLDKIIKETSLRARLVCIKRDTAAVQANRAEHLLEKCKRFQNDEDADAVKKSIVAEEKRFKFLTEKISEAYQKSKKIDCYRESRIKMFSDLTGQLARELLPDGIEGVFDMSNPSCPFTLSASDGGTDKGIEVLIGDFVCLLDSCNPASAFPGLIVHDHPRDADISAATYTKFLHLVMHIERDCFNGFAPYQYIVDT